MAEGVPSSSEPRLAEFASIWPFTDRLPLTMTSPCESTMRVPLARLMMPPVDWRARTLVLDEMELA